MQDRTKRIINILKIAGFSLYFFILFIERLLAVILSVHSGEKYALTSGNVFNYIAYSVTVAGLAVGTALFCRLFFGVIRALRAKETYLFDAHVKEWSIAAFVLLFAGMMHTGYTLAGVQFAAYGFLIGAMVVACVEACLSGENKFVSVVSVLYVTFFSMSIPVCYISFLAAPMNVLFFVAEFLAVLVLVPMFGNLLFSMMRKGTVAFSPCIPAAMCILSGAVVGLGWTEDVNMFVLIFAGLTLLFYLTFGLVARHKSKSRPESQE